MPDQRGFLLLVKTSPINSIIGRECFSKLDERKSENIDRKGIQNYRDKDFDFKGEQLKETTSFPPRNWNCNFQLC